MLRNIIFTWINPTKLTDTNFFNSVHDIHKLCTYNRQTALGDKELPRDSHVDQGHPGLRDWRPFLNDYVICITKGMTLASRDKRKKFNQSTKLKHIQFKHNRLGIFSLKVLNPPIARGTIATEGW